MSRNSWLVLGCFLGVCTVQFSQIFKLKRDVTELQRELSTKIAVEHDSNSAGNVQASSNASEEGTTIQQRLARLEEAFATLERPPRFGPEVGRDGDISQAVRDEFALQQQVLLDPAASDNERLRALRMLRRNQLNDETVTQTLQLLQSSTNANFRRELLQHLDGVTNAALKQPLLAMIETEAGENGLREQAVSMLRRFADDPGVEAKLWDLALSDPNARIQGQAREALARAPATPERLDQLLTRASNPEASLDERLISFRALRLAKSHTPELVSDLANLAQNSTDPIARAKLFKSFNGLTEPSLMLPLVNGLQDADPVVRQNAVNALSEFPDPRVQQWLTHLIQNDNDPAVKREAHAALERTQRLHRQGP